METTTRKCALDGCENHFTPDKRHPNQKYCSTQHNRKAREKKRALGNVNDQSTLFSQQSTVNSGQWTVDSRQIEPKVPKAITPPLPPNMSDSAAFMVQWITKDRDRFEELYKTERDTRKKLRDAKEALEKEFEKYKNAQELEKIANAKPSGLSGLSENPLVMKLIDHVGPALGKIAERLAEPSALPATQLAGNDQGAVNFAQWLATKQPDTQQYIVKMLMALSAIPDENILIQKIGQIEGLVLGEYMRATG